MLTRTARLSIFVWSETPVDNLVGGQFEANMAARSETMLVGDVRTSKFEGYELFEIQLRPVSPESEQLMKLILNAAESFIAAAFPKRGQLKQRQRLEQAFEHLAKSDQLEVAVSQQMVLDDAFKSVFLVSSCPRILSGEVACEIVGGVYPKLLEDVHRKRLQQFIPDDQRRFRTTVIELPLDAGKSAAEVLPRFQQLAHLLVVFGRRIHEVTLRHMDSQEVVWRASWQPHPVADVCLAGRIEPSGYNVGHHAVATRQPVTHAIVLHAHGAGRPNQAIASLLMPHDGYRVCRRENGKLKMLLSDEIPTLWVTAPTQETLKLGFLINADFDIDPGRANLGRSSEKNDSLAIQLGQQFGQRLCALFAKFENDPASEFRTSLGLAPDSDLIGFWESLWDLISNRVAELPDDDSQHAARLVRRIFWGTDHGAAACLYRDHAALPNYLPGEFRKLIPARAVRFAVTGFLLDVRVLKAVENWDSFRQRVGNRDCLIAKQLVGEPLRKLGNGLSGEGPRDLSLAQLLVWEAEINPCLQPDRAELLAKLLFTVCDHGRDQHQQEWSAIESTLKSFRFLDSNSVLRRNWSTSRGRRRLLRLRLGIPRWRS